MKTSLLALALLVSGTGCAAQSAAATTDDAITDSSAIAPGDFKLYSTPNPELNASCDVHTELKLGDRAAELHEAVSGTCEIFVEPNARTYELTLGDEECGSKFYSGTTKVRGEVRQLTIADHRTRICRDMVPAQIIVEEKDGAGTTLTSFSLDAAN